MAEGEFALVRHHLEEGLPKVGWPTEWGSMGSNLDVYALLVEAAVGRRDEAAIGRDAPRLAEMAAAVGHTLYQAIAQRAWGVAHRLSADPAAAEGHLQQALALFEQLDTRWQIGRTLFELGELARSQPAGNTAAPAYYSRALALFEELGAAPDAGRVRLVLAELTEHD
jgi:hypothetical protein